MENASKALLMAGGILIAIITIALLVKSFTSISSFQEAKLTQKQQEEIVAFNEQYTKYLGQYVYGVEVATLKNKYDNDGLVYVNVLPEGTQIPTGIGQDTQYYKCKNITYDNQTGRVNSITFEKITINSEG